MAIIDLKAVKPNVVSKTFKGHSMYLVSSPKAGKTTFASQVPRNLVLATERGYSAIPGIQAMDINSWSEFKQAVTQLADPEIQEMFDVVTIDTIDVLWDYCSRAACANAGVSSLGDVGFGKLYAQVRTDMDRQLRKIVDLGYGLIIIGHIIEKTYNVGTDNEYVRIVPSLSGKDAEVINKIVDMIAFVYPDWDSNGNPHNKMYFREKFNFLAGSRFKYMSECIDFDYKTFMDEMISAIEKEEKEKGGQFFTDKAPEAIQEKKYDLGELHKEFNEVVASIPGATDSELKTTEGQKFATYWQPLIAKIIADNIGQGNKVKDITLDQAEAFETIIHQIKHELKNG